MLGGNAIDAAVATAISLAVTYPQAGNLGGGGFMLIKVPGRPTECLDYRESAPRNVRAELFRFNGENRALSSSISGGLAVAIPGTIAGLDAALTKYGSWSWDRIVGVAVDLADKGIWITNRQANYYSMYEDDLRRYDSTSDVFLPGGHLPLPGDLFVQPDLARTLRLLAEHGPAHFYTGEIGERIVASIAETGGVLDMEDMASYRPLWRRPLSRRVWGRDVYTTPLPSGGGLVVMLALGLLEACGVHDTKPRSVDRWEMIGRCLRIAFAKRSDFAGDPIAMPSELVTTATELACAAQNDQALERFEQELTIPIRRIQGAMPPRNTTHFSVIDKDGWAVSNTYSLNTLFGSKLVARGTGVLLNNTIDDFGIAPGVPNWYQLFEGRYNSLGPGRRPTGSMTPTMVVNADDVVELSIGASGGPRIPSLVAQVIVGVLVDRLGLTAAMQMPRVHHQFMPLSLDIEDAIPQTDAEELERRGYEVLRYPRLGIGAGIQNDLDAKTLFAALDPRF